MSITEEDVPSTLGTVPMETSTIGSGGPPLVDGHYRYENLCFNFDRGEDVADQALDSKGGCRSPPWCCFSVLNEPFADLVIGITAPMSHICSGRQPREARRYQLWMSPLEPFPEWMVHPPL